MPVVKRSEIFRRYFGKIIDLVLLGYLIDLLFKFISLTYRPTTSIDPWTILLPDFTNVTQGVLTILVFICIEALLIARYGTTLGKYCMGIQVLKKDNTQLNFKSSLKRSFLSMMRGLGFGIPLITIFTQALSYYTLRDRNGFTSWDTSTHSFCKIQQWNAWRSFLTLLLFIVILLMLKMGNAVYKLRNSTMFSIESETIIIDPPTKEKSYDQYDSETF